MLYFLRVVGVHREEVWSTGVLTADVEVKDDQGSGVTKSGSECGSGIAGIFFKDCFINPVAEDMDGNDTATSLPTAESVSKSFDSPLLIGGFLSFCFLQRSEGKVNIVGTAKARSLTVCPVLSKDSSVKWFEQTTECNDGVQFFHLRFLTHSLYLLLSFSLFGNLYFSQPSLTGLFLNQSSVWKIPRHYSVQF